MGFYGENYWRLKSFISAPNSIDIRTGGIQNQVINASHVFNPHNTLCGKFNCPHFISGGMEAESG